MANKVFNMLCSRGISSENQIKITMYVIKLNEKFLCSARDTKKKKHPSTCSSLAYLTNYPHKENVCIKSS